MTDRDTFAAAALTGLLYHNHEPPKPVRWWTEQAYEYADAMLRERTQHNAGPIFPSRDTASGVTSPPFSSGGPINRSAESQSPDVNGGGGEPLDVSQPDNGLAAGGRGHNTQEPVAWAAMYANGALAWTDHRKEACLMGATERAVIPLYRQPQPTLTAEEREAIEWAAEMIPAMAHPSSCSAHIHAATLRALLERTK